MLDNFYKNQYNNNKEIMDMKFNFSSLSISLMAAFIMIGLSINMA